jgi:hypothetical protein
LAIDAQAQKVIQYLIGKEKEIGQAITDGKERPWVDYKDVQAAEPFDFSAVHQIFSRNKSNDEYATLRQDPKAQNIDLATAKLSADYLAGLEQSYRQRTRSRVRTFVHAANRRAGNGTEDGPMFKNSMGWWNRILGEQEI